MQGVLHVLRVPGFGRLAATYTLSELAEWFATIALSVLVYDATRDPLATTALFLALKFLPGLAVPVLTARLDGLPPARLLGAMYLVEAVAVVTLALSAATFLLPVVLVLSFVFGALSATANAVTRSATVATLEEHEALREGNAVLNVGFSAMNAGGPALAGGFVALAGARPALGVAAVVFMAQALVVGTAKALRRGDLEEGPWGKRLIDGLSYVRRNVRLRTLLFGQGLVLVLLTMATPIEVVYAKESLDAGDAGFGLLLASWGIGMVAGSAIFARERERSMVALIVVSTIVQALGYLGMAVAPVLAWACAAAFVGGLGNGVQWVAVVTALQEATEERYQARMAGVLEAVMAIAPGTGFLIGGVVTTLMSPRVAFGAAGAGVILVTLIGVAILGRSALSTATVEPAAEPAAGPTA